jgi:hypothetical protein
MVVVVCSVLLQKLWSAKYSATWNTWGDRQMGIHQYLVMGISWSSDPQGFQHKYCGYNCLKLLPYANGHHIKALKHFVYV